MQLRKICQHPFLFESVEDKVNPSSMIDDKLIRSSGKIELLNRILPKFFATDHRVSPPIILDRLRPAILTTRVPGSHLLPNDKGHGHHGRLPQDDGWDSWNVEDEYEEMEGRGHRNSTVVSYNDGLPVGHGE